MTEQQKKLASRLLYLPLDLTEKVFLWLTFKGLKPVSEITAQKRNKAHNHRMMKDKKYRETYKSTYDFNSQKSKRIRKWIHDAGLYAIPESKGDISWHVGKDKEKTKLSAKIIRKFDYENELKSGLLFGFPKASVKAYALERIRKGGERQIPMIWPGDKDDNPYLKDKYFTPYVLFAIRKDKVEKDSMIAKRWADTIRQDLPKLAKWFENRAKKNKERTLKWEGKNKKRLNKPILEIFSDYKKEVKLSNNRQIKRVFLKILKDFFEGGLSTNQLGYLAHELLGITATLSNKAADKDMNETIKTAEDIYKLEGKSGRPKVLASKLKKTSGLVQR